MTSLRIFGIGGLITFRALFSFLRPEVYIPGMLVAPIFQILLFVYVGRSASLETDEFYVIGNAVQYAAVPCLFAMIFTIAGERYQQTLGYILVSPAARLPLFLGRAVPVMVNGFFVAAFSLAVGGLIVGIEVPASALAPLALATAICTFSCTGLGLIGAGIGLLLRAGGARKRALRDPARLHRRQRARRHASRLDAGDLVDPPLHARHRGGPRDR